MRSIYLDHNATTPVRLDVFKAMEPFFITRFGNASSIHRFGQDTRSALEVARRQVAELVNGKAGEIYFTSGGTESDNLAIKGIAYTRKNQGKHIITTNIEHSAVLNSCAFLEQQGYEVTYLPVNQYGRIDSWQVAEALTDQTILITIMHANNEIGTIQPVEEIGKIAEENNICFHIDAVQSAGKIPIDVQEFHADLLSISSHKIYGPKGVGALYIREGIIIEPTTHGGHHEKDVRSGTENTAGIVGLGKAAELAAHELQYESENLLGMRNALEEGIINEIDRASINGHPKWRLPSTLNVSFPGGEGESLIMSLDLEGIAVSTGSACSSGAIEPSHVLMALGIDPKTALGSIRFSFGRDNTLEDVDYVMQKLPGIVSRIRNYSPVSSIS
tara:strand:- start:135914 stop:137077 length:1164 start_codon:yes stop_codon:yes gene_type:complete